MLIDHTTDKPVNMEPKFAEDLGYELACIEDRLFEVFEISPWTEGEANSQNLAGTWFYETLPKSARPNVKKLEGAQELFLLARRFLVTLHTLAWKIFTSRNYSLGNRAEELLLSWALGELKNSRVERAERENEESGRAIHDIEDVREKVSEEIAEYSDSVFEDADFEMLYDPRMDGAEYDEQLMTGSLRVKDWFLPFNADAVTNPLTWPADKKFDFKAWKGFAYPDT